MPYDPDRQSCFTLDNGKLYVADVETSDGGLLVQERPINEGRPEGWTWKDWRGCKTDGRMPDDHPRRCQVRRKKGYEHLKRKHRPLYCTRNAERGSLFCRRHSTNKGRRSTHRMPMSYRVVNKTLQRRLRQFEDSEREALQLREELNLCRVSADEAIAVFGATLEMVEAANLALDESESDEKSRVAATAKLDQARALHEAAGQAMRNVLAEIRSAALDAARIEQLSGGQFSATAVRSIITQITKVMYEVCGDEHQHLAEDFVSRITRKVQVADTEKGTMLTPDQDVREMDDMVPRIEQDDSVD